MTRQFLAIPAASATAERVFSFAGLTLSDLRKSLLEGNHVVQMGVSHLKTRLIYEDRCDEEIKNES